MSQHFERPESADDGINAASPADNKEIKNDKRLDALTEKISQKPALGGITETADEPIKRVPDKRQEVLSEMRSELSTLMAEKELLGNVPPEALKDFRNEIYTMGEEWIDRLNEHPGEDLSGFVENLKELRKGFVDEYITDATEDMLDHFNPSLEVAVNGAKAAELMTSEFRNTLAPALEEYIESGDLVDFKVVRVSMQIAKYPVGAEEKKFITSISVTLKDANKQ